MNERQLSSELPHEMRAVHIVREGAADSAFEIRTIARPDPGPGQVLVQVECFGLNYADVMARLGQYRDRPPLPSVIGYDVAGRIVGWGAGVEGFRLGERVCAMTRFGGYAEFALTDHRAVARIPEGMDAAAATALATQYCTAWMAAERLVRLEAGDQVLIQAAAGGVGTALVQIAKHRGCVVYGTAGSEAKLEYLREQGVDHPINYRERQFDEAVRALMPDEGLDVVFDSLGGKAVSQARKLLGSGGRIVMFGGASATGLGTLGQLRWMLGFGFVHPGMLIMQSRSIIGLNMLSMADHRPHYLGLCMKEVVRLSEEGVLKPTVGGRYPAEDIAEAHRFLEGRSSIGKIAVFWNA